MDSVSETNSVLSSNSQEVDQKVDSSNNNEEVDSSDSGDSIPEVNELLQLISSRLTEEQWTRTSVDNYTQKGFIELDEILELAKSKNLEEALRQYCIQTLEKYPKSIISLYIAGILTYEQKGIDESYLAEIISLFKNSKKWSVIEYLAHRIMKYGENKFALSTLEECYQKTNDEEKIIEIWKRLFQVDYENGETAKKLAAYYEKENQEKEAIFFYKNALSRFSKEGKLKECTTIWENLLNYIADDVDFFFSIEKEIRRSDPQKSFELVKTILPYYQEKKDITKIILICKHLLSISTKDKEIRDLIVESLLQENESHPLLEEYIKKSRLKDYTYNINKAIEKFEKYIPLNEDTYVFHRSWGIGKIMECNTDSLVINFEYKQNHEMSFKIALSSLKSLPTDHIWIKKRKDPESFKKNDPESIKDILTDIFKSFDNEASIKQIKKEMLEVLTLIEWNSWWTKARQVIKRSSLFGVLPNNRNVYFLRCKPISFDEETYNQFIASSQFTKKLDIFLDYFRHTTNIESEYTQLMLNYFVEICNNKETIDEKTIQSFLLLTKIKKEKPELFFELKVNINDIMELSDKFIEIYEQLSDNEFRKEFLDIIRKNHTDWKSIFLHIFKSMRTTRAHNIILDEFVKQDDFNSIKDAFEYLLDNYRTNPESYFWAIKTLISQPKLQEQLKFEQKKLTFNLFYCLDIINKEINSKNDVINKKKIQAKNYRKLFSQIVDFLIKEEIFLNYVKEIPAHEAKKVFVLMNGLTVLNLKNLSYFTNKIYEVLPDLYQEEAEKSQDDMHLSIVTRNAYNQKQKDLQHLLNVAIPNNSKSIGTAQERGDLRENAEYIIALEQQKQLQKIVSTMTKELNQVKILNPDEIDVSRINPGTTVHLENIKTKTIEQYTILGEWESDMEKGIISYKSPFGQSLLGNKVKKSVIFNHAGIQKRYRVKKIEKAHQVL